MEGFLLGLILGMILGAVITFGVLAALGEAERKNRGHYE